MGLIEIIVGVVALLAGLFGGQVIGKRQGRKQERTEREAQDAKNLNKVIRDVNNADADKPDSPSDAAGRLQQWFDSQ